MHVWDRCIEQTSMDWTSWASNNSGRRKMNSHQNVLTGIKVSCYDVPFQLENDAQSFKTHEIYKNSIIRFSCNESTFRVSGPISHFSTESGTRFRFRQVYIRVICLEILNTRSHWVSLINYSCWTDWIRRLYTFLQRVSVPCFMILQVLMVGLRAEGSELSCTKLSGHPVSLAYWKRQTRLPLSKELTGGPFPLFQSGLESWPLNQRASDLSLGNRQQSEPITAS